MHKCMHRTKEFHNKTIRCTMNMCACVCGKLCPFSPISLAPCSYFNFRLLFNDAVISLTPPPIHSIVNHDPILIFPSLLAAATAAAAGGGSDGI